MDHCSECSAYRTIFPDLAPQKGGTALDELRTTTSGYRPATSIHGVVTGKGAHYIFLDDPIKAGDANSEVVCNQAYEFLGRGVIRRATITRSARKNVAIGFHLTPIGGQGADTSPSFRLVMNKEAGNSVPTPSSRARSMMRLQIEANWMPIPQLFI